MALKAKSNKKKDRKKVDILASLVKISLRKYATKKLNKRKIYSLTSKDPDEQRGG
jgi:hypothetical protein